MGPKDRFRNVPSQLLSAVLQARQSASYKGRYKQIPRRLWPNYYKLSLWLQHRIDQAPVNDANQIHSKARDACHGK